MHLEAYTRRERPDADDDGRESVLDGVGEQLGGKKCGVGSDIVTESGRVHARGDEQAAFAHGVGSFVDLQARPITIRGDLARIVPRG